MKISHLRLAREFVMLLITIIHLINAVMVLVGGATKCLTEKGLSDFSEL